MDPSALIRLPAGRARAVVITCAVTGGVHGKEANPALPEQPDEIVRAAVECQRAGAAIVHCHARDESGASTADVAVFEKILEGLRRETDLLVNFTTGGAPGQTVDERLAVLDLAPDVVTLNTGTMLYQVPGEAEELFVNERETIVAIARRAQGRGIKPELEVYNTAMLREVEHLAEQGLLEPPPLINAVLQTPMQGGELGTVANVMQFVDRLPSGAVFTVTSCGRTQLHLTTLAMLIGAHVRVGFEDNVYYARGQLAESNAQLVERSRRQIQELGLRVADPDEARQLLNLDQPSQVVGGSA
jgi:3-keto-5-aminohexanoate cleavage enzyme